MQTSFEFVGLELLVQCSSCAAATPVNRPEQRTLCSTCLRETEVDDEAWSKALAGAGTSFTQLGMGVTESGKLDRPGRDVEWSRGPARPKCPNCSAGMRASADGASAVCWGCKVRCALERPPAFLVAKSPSIVGVLADPVPQPGTNRPKPLGMSCTQCGGNVTSDGSKRTVDCPFCNTTNILPDDVWRALHPPKLRRRFWLLFELTPDPRRVTLNPSADMLGWLLFFAVPLALVSTCGAFASLANNRNRGGFPQYAYYWLLWFGPLFLLVAVTLIWKWLRVRPIVREGQEVVGRLLEWSGGSAAVELFDPKNPAVVLGSDQLELDEAKYKALGGAGGLLRAWAKPDRTKFKVIPEPSGLG
jgi:hypothetical protein